MNPTEAETWEDCIALLKAGAPPTEVLPSLRALFQSLPATNDEIQDNAEQMAPDSSSRSKVNLLKSKLQFQLDKKYPPFPIPYLRPPGFLWNLLRDADGRLPPECSIFDSEIDFPILSSFRPCIVPPPPPSVRRLLESQASWDPSCTENGTKSHSELHSAPGAVNALQTQNTLTPSQNVGPPVMAQMHQKDTVTRTVQTVSRALSDCLQVDKSKPDASTQSSSIEIPVLDENLWSAAMSDIDLHCTLSLTAIEQLLHRISQPAFATVVLFSWLPLLMHSTQVESSTAPDLDDDASDYSEKFLNVLRLAATIADIPDWPVLRLAALTALFQSVDEDDPLPGLAQTSILLLSSHPKRG